MNCAVSVDRLVVRFGEIEAVAGISFAVEHGETFGLLGPNGVGKTTTLRVPATLLPPTCGHAFVIGRDVRRESLPVRAVFPGVRQRPLDKPAQCASFPRFECESPDSIELERGATADERLDVRAGLLEDRSNLARTLLGLELLDKRAGPLFDLTENRSQPCTLGRELGIARPTRCSSASAR